MPNATNAPSRSRTDALDNDNQEHWEAQVQADVDTGQFFVAYDVASAALERFPQSLRLKQLAALALRKTGAVSEALNILRPLCPPVDETDPQLMALYSAVRKIVPLVSPGHDEPPTPIALEALSALLETFAGGVERATHHRDEETLGLLAGCYKTMWERTGTREDGVKARDAYLHAYQLSSGYWTAINAATLSWILDDRELASTLAESVRAALSVSPPAESESDRYWRLATIGEACLLLGRADEAADHYGQAAKLATDRRGQLASSMRQLGMLEDAGMEIPLGIREALKAPVVAAFIGHRIDQQGAPPRFPASLEAAVRAEIDRVIDELGVTVGYSSAANGSDLLFLEAMQERGAETHIVMPCQIDDFIRVSVAPAGARWVTRFRRAVSLASSIRYVTEEPIQGDLVLFELMGRMFYGFAALHARTLLTEPELIAVWNGDVNGPKGGTADILCSWPLEDRVTTIRIDHLLANAPAPAVPAPDAAEAASAQPGIPGAERHIKTMLFADVVGFSKLKEVEIPSFMHRFLTHVASKLPHKPRFVNTWGDGIFALMDTAVEMADYAVALQDVVCATDWSKHEMPGSMSIRIGLHAGPVFEAMDPIAGRVNYYGSHVNRTARIEPVTVPGNVYASEQFVALLLTEQAAARVAAEQREDPYVPSVEAEYIGVLALAKNYASQPMFHLRAATAHEKALAAT